MDRAAKGKTVLTNFEQTCVEIPDQPALKWKDSSGAWRTLTWAQYRLEARKATAGLKALGFRPGEFGVIMARNRPEHLIADLGVLHSRGTSVSLYNTLAPEQVQYIANHCDAVVAFVDNAGFLAKFEAVRDQLPKLRHIVVMDADGVADRRQQLVQHDGEDDDEGRAEEAAHDGAQAADDDHEEHVEGSADIEGRRLP